MMIQLLAVLEPATFILGLLLVLTALFQYVQRTNDYHGIWRILINKLKDGFIVSEFKIYRLGVSILLIGLVLRLINHIFFPSY